MVIKVYISQISASKETKKRQQRAQMILDSLDIKYELVDVTEPVAIPPQFFNGDTYCGDYEDFDAANDEDKVRVLLELESDTKEEGA